ncbi:FecR family protein [Winogradskyella sp. F6397]|uniref:FecR family protein n=1 Tax=Winogradskyella marina TaxID=2785530 RepID=A0ABS0EJV5_9FLAO|nr:MULTISPECIES: FecR family protein [Winogradskyella]MBF8150745.1 FecR family protein [Winogradskyella marina]
MINFNKIIILSKQIAASLLKDEKAESLESSDLFSQEEKDNILKRLTDKSEIASRFQLKNKIDKKEDWQSLKSKLHLPKKTYYWQYATAASIALIMALTFVYHKIDTQKVDPVLVDTKIEIGTDKAILTLSDGSTVLLDSTNVYQNKSVNGNGNKITYGSAESNNQELEFNYLTVPRGGQYHVELSDGTEVWLNSESQLKYPVNFIEGNPREVELVYGEAYLEVSKSTKHNGDTFTLKTKEQNLTVLGTIFNVNAVKNETEIITTLVEGSILLSNDLNTSILVPSQQARLSQDKSDFEISTVEVEEFISWRNGVFSFTNKSLKDIMKVLSRWYDVDILIVNEEMENVGFTGVLNKQQSIENILEIIKSTNNMNYKIENKHITIE